MTTGQRRPSGSWLVAAAAFGFLAGMLALAALIVNFPEEARRVLAIAGRTADAPELPGTVEIRPSPSREPSPVAPPPAATEAATPRIEAEPLNDLRGRLLEVPVKGAARSDLRASFTERRGGTRAHEAIDLLAPRHTPVVAVEDGSIAKLFFSKAGGITVYQFDPTKTYVYYYAHLDRYADGLVEGDAVRRGQTLGYVGTSGNAPEDTPHLHFAIFRMTEQKQWWQGSPIDPFQVLR